MATIELTSENLDSSVNIRVSHLCVNLSVKL